MSATVSATDPPPERFSRWSTPRGTVALAEAWASGPTPLGRCQITRASSSERVGQTEGRTDIGPEIVEAPAEVLNEGVRGDDDPGGAVTLQPAHGSESSLQASVVGLKRVVGMDLRVMESRRHQLIEHTGVDPGPIGGDVTGRDPGPID